MNPIERATQMKKETDELIKNWEHPFKTPADREAHEAIHLAIRARLARINATISAAREELERDFPQLRG